MVLTIAGFIVLALVYFFFFFRDAEKKMNEIDLEKKENFISSQIGGVIAALSMFQPDSGLKINCINSKIEEAALKLYMSQPMSQTSGDFQIDTLVDVVKKTIITLTTMLVSNDPILETLRGLLHKIQTVAVITNTITSKNSFVVKEECITDFLVIEKESIGKCQALLN